MSELQVESGATEQELEPKSKTAQPSSKGVHAVNSQVSQTARDQQSSSRNPQNKPGKKGAEQKSVPAEQPEQEPSSSEANFAELEARLGERIADEVERRFQSAKDRRWAQLEKQYGALRQAQRVQGMNSNEQRRGASSIDDSWVMARAQHILEGAGLANDPEVLELFHEGQYTPDVEGYLDLLGDITEVTLRRANRPHASAAAVAQPGGSNLPEPDLRDEYEQRRKRLRPGDVGALMELKREFRQKGLNVY